MACRSKDPSGGGNDRRLSLCVVDRPSIFHFYKIILSTTLEEKKLRIPYKFVKRFRDELTNVVDLVIPNGRVWKVGLSKSRNKIWFDDGWQNFAEHHSIDNGHFLLFGYRGLCSFDVFIFDTTASEIEYPCHNNESPNYDEIFVARNEVQMPDDSPPSEMLNSVNLSPCSSSLKSKVSNGSANKRYSGETPSKLEQKLQIKRGRELEHLSSRKRSPKVDQVVEIIDIDDNETRREKLGKQRISEFDKPVTIKQEFGGVKCKSGERGAECEDKEVEIVMIRKSKRNKETTPKTKRTMEAARKYIPKNPSFIISLREYHFHNNRLYVPTSFSGYLSGASKNLKLKVSDGREWEAHLYQRFNRWDIGGWSAFHTDNYLENGDVCVFELLKSKGVLEVSIFRGSEDGTHGN